MMGGAMCGGSGGTLFFFEVVFPSRQYPQKYAAAISISAVEGGAQRCGYI